MKNHSCALLTEALIKVLRTLTKRGKIIAVNLGDESVNHSRYWPVPYRLGHTKDQQCQKVY